MRLLLVEDSEALSEALMTTLSREGYACDHAADGAVALEYLSRYPYDLVVLDLMLPRRSGFDVLQAMRLQGNSASVLILSARDHVDDRVTALDIGADDYLIKPFALDELLARLRALARRAPPDSEPGLVHPALQIDRRNRKAHWNGVDMALTPKEYSLLELLFKHRGQVFSRSQLFEHLYNSTSNASDKVIEVVISTLRSKMSRAGAGNPIRTRRGFGYVFE